MRSPSNIFRPLLGKVQAISETARFRYAFLYICILLIFAVIYWLLPGKHFYHANVSHEPLVGEIKARIGKQLTAEIVGAFQQVHHGVDQLVVNEWRVDPTTFEVITFDATADKPGVVEIKFKLSTKLINLSNPSRLLNIAPVVTLPASGGYESASILLKAIHVDVPPEVPYMDATQRNLFAQILFPTPKPSEPHNESNPVEEDKSGLAPELSMPMSKNLDSQIQDLAQGVQGDPSRLDGHFMRMLYLSGVTITTLGYGDIAPLTPWSRLFILIEAVIGIIIIGLFIAGGNRPSLRWLWLMIKPEGLSSDPQ